MYKKKLYYFFLTIIFQTSSALSMKFYLFKLMRRQKNPSIYFDCNIFHNLFIILYYFYPGLPKKNHESKKNFLPKFIKVCRKKVNTIKLYKKIALLPLMLMTKKRKTKKQS